MQFALMGVFLLASTGNVGATAAAQVENPAESRVAKPKPKKICVKNEEETGSRLGGRKVCKTEEEWALEAEQRRLNRGFKDVVEN